MDSDFRQMVDSLEPKFQALIGMSPVRYGCLPSELPRAGVYLFSESGKHLYVGRTKRLRQRLRGHCVPSGSHFTATFAFRIARQVTGKTKAAYTKAGSRASWLRHEEFRRAFEAAKRRIVDMDLRFVDEIDSTRQALLEIYAATVLRTPFNDFDNH
jgi:predicted GIY-YIG superfamily endonuclease